MPTAVSLATTSTAATTTAAFTAAVSTTAATNADDGREESNYVVINEPPWTAGNKGKTPFVCLSGNVRARILHFNYY